MYFKLIKLFDLLNVAKIQHYYKKIQKQSKNQERSKFFDI